jgi:hypothetical protein
VIRNTVSPSLLQGLDQVVERGRADRVQPGGGLVQEQQRRVERERAGQAGTLAHAAGQLRGSLATASAGRPASFTFSSASS